MTHMFTSSEKEKLAGIEAGATIDQSKSEIESLIDGLFCTVSGSDTLLHSNDTNRDISFTPNTYTKIKETKTSRISGTIRVFFRAWGSYDDSRIKIYVNDIAVGTERIPAGGDFTDYSEDIAIVEDDIIQLYVYSPAGGQTMVQNLRLKGTLTAAPMQLYESNDP